MRITLFFFRAESAVRSLHTPVDHAVTASHHRGHTASAIEMKAQHHTRLNFTPITGRAADLYAHPVRVGECHFDLMSVRKVSDAGE